MSFLLSVVTPAFNEEANLPVYMAQLKALAERLEKDGVAVEVVLVDDHSTDGTPEIARQLVATGGLPMKYLRLSRNCGSHAALSAGLRHCAGDAAVLLAVDLQDPPALIQEMLSRHREGYEVVWAVRAARQGEAWHRVLTSNLYYALMRLISSVDMPAQGADFLLFSRKVIDAYNSIPEKHTSLLAMILWMGFRQTSVSYVKQVRHAGQSKWTFFKKLKLFIDSVVSFSYVPIRFMSVFGFLMAALGFLWAIVVLVGWLVGTVTHGTGYAALMTVLLIGQGMIIMMLGILGEYLWRTYDEARGRPRYLVEEYRASGVGSQKSEVGGQESEVRGRKCASQDWLKRSS